MVELPKIISKRTWFVIFNTATILYLIATRSLQWNVVSVFSYGLALLLINCIALPSNKTLQGMQMSLATRPSSST
jgi:hypothetical protein